MAGCLTGSSPLRAWVPGLPAVEAQQLAPQEEELPQGWLFQACEPHSLPQYKAGRTHIVRQIDKPESKVNKKEVVEAGPIVEMLPIGTVGIVHYVETPRGL